MNVYVVEDYVELSKKAARIVLEQIHFKKNSTLGLATGSTPLGMYKELINLYNNGLVDFSQVKTFNLDEYYGLSKSNNQSYYYYMKENFFQQVNIPEHHIDIPDGMAEWVEEECLRYEKRIEISGGIDLQILGIGRNGHIGFNEPDFKFEALTHLVNLDEDTIRANSRFFSSIKDVPNKAISMGMKTIMNSKKILLMASGKEKAEAIKNTIKGKINPGVPASILQLHSSVILLVDKEAASMVGEYMDEGLQKII